jgi:hypothetical protein
LKAFLRPIWQCTSDSSGDGITTCARLSYDIHHYFVRVTREAADIAFQQIEANIPNGESFTERRCVPRRSAEEGECCRRRRGFTRSCSREIMMRHTPKRESDGLTHSKPSSVDQQSEDSFPTSDPPSFSPGAVGAPRGKTEPAKAGHEAVKAAEKRVKSGGAKKPEDY